MTQSAAAAEPPSWAARTMIDASD